MHVVRRYQSIIVLMGSEESNKDKLPLIEFSKEKLEGGGAAWEEVKHQVRLALEQYGCFEASFDAISGGLREATFRAIEELFDLPLETKLRNISDKPYHGYVGQYPMVPLYESMGFDDADIIDRVESVGSQLWPRGNSTFCKTIQSFSERLSELDKIVRMMVVESLGVEEHIEEHMESTTYLLRVMKYKGARTSKSELGLSAHTDKNMVTILCENQVNGLQVESTKNKGEWIQVKPSSPNHFIVMIGDSLYAWSNGRLHSPRHRVMMSGNEARYSAGLFSIPKPGYMIKAPDELVDDDHHPRLFKPFDHHQFLSFYYSEAGQRAHSALHTYCGL